MVSFWGTSNFGFSSYQTVVLHSKSLFPMNMLATVFVSALNPQMHVAAACTVEDNAAALTFCQPIFPAV